jgi:glycosyl-4,4'-diaponeurosporenoate acyltransferase
MIALVWVANVLGWPVIHVTIGFAALHVPPHLFESDSWITAPRPWGRDGHVYQDRLAIRRWKLLLPDAAPWLGGFAKKSQVAAS